MRIYWRARLKRGISAGVGTLAIVMCSAHAVSAQSARRPHPIRIVGTDYAFTAPDTVSAGPSAFQFENRGAKRHEVAVVLARTATTAAQIAIAI